MTLALFENIPFIMPLLGGMLIGLSASLLLLFNGRIAGMSGMMQGVYPSEQNRPARLFFLAGLLISAVLVQFMSNDPLVPEQHHPLLLLIIGGFLVGFGTRLGNGCVSGHGICGLANFSFRSLVASLVFMAMGMVSVFVSRHVLELTL